MCNAAFGVGCGVGAFSGIRNVLIEGRWLVAALPINTVADTVSRPMTVKVIESLAVGLKDALNEPSFVPRLARPIWRFIIGQAIPLESLTLVPSRIIETLQKNPKAAVAPVVEAVLLALASEGIRNLQSKYRQYSVGGLLFLSGLIASGMNFIWGSGTDEKSSS